MRGTQFVPSHFQFFYLDSSGEIVVEYSYDAWGNHTIKAYNKTIANANPFRYRSYFYDTDTGLYYLKTRYYDPEVGRFLNMDAVDYADPETLGGLNLYSYCNNNPVMYIDPTGHYYWLIFGVIGAVVGVTGQLTGDLISGEWSSWQEYVGATVGGFVAGSAATIMGPTAASVVGSLSADAVTIGLNLLTDQEKRSNGQIVTDVIENVILTSVFSFGSSFTSGVLGRSVGSQLFRPLSNNIGKISLTLFFKELTSEMINGTVETFFDEIYYMIKRVLEEMF